MLSLEAIIALLKKDELPAYAKQKQSFFSAIFSGDDWHKTMALGNIELQIRNSNLISSLHTLVREKQSLFDLTVIEYLEYKRKYKVLLQDSRSLSNTIETYIKNERWTGLDYQYLRYLLFFVAFKEYNHDTATQRNIIAAFPITYRLEVVLIIILGKLGAGNIQDAFTDIHDIKRYFKEEEDVYQQNYHWFYKFLFTESTFSYTDATTAAVDLFEVTILELEEQHSAEEYTDWNRWSKIVPETYNFYTQVNELENDELIEFCKLILISKHPQIYSLFELRHNTKHINKLIQKANWTPESMVDLITLCTKPKNSIKLPTGLFKPMKVLLKNGAKDIFNILWAYYNEVKGTHNDSKTVSNILKEFSLIFEDEKTEEVALHQVLTSGFSPLPPSTTQNVYKGMIPAQVRPFFQLMREVGNVDIVKFYQDQDKNHFVRFQINDQQFDLATSNGLGVGIMQPLNTLLFENGIPYQFVICKKNGLTDSFDISYVLWSKVRVTLVNKVTYEKYTNHFPASPITGFAESDKPVYAFVKRGEVLKTIQLKVNLDKIDLAKDPKFSIIKEELTKLSNLPVWTALLTQCLRYPLSTPKPNKGWQKEAIALVEKLGKEAFQSGHLLILEKLTIGDEWFQDTEKLSALRGLSWLSKLHPGNGQLYMLQKISNRAYKKIPGGPLNAKLGNLALETLAEIGSLNAFGIVNNIEAKAKYSVYKRAIASRKKKFKKLLEQFSPEELADRSVAAHGLVEGKINIPIGDCEALLEMDGFKVNILWQTAKGKTQKSIPTHLKKEFAGEVKVIKAEGKSIVETLSSQSKRLEKSWLSQHTWTVSNWQEFLLHHGLMSVITERLIWIAEEDGKSNSFMIHEGEFIDYQGNNIKLNKGAVIQLWHPSVVSVEETLAWRNHIFRHQIKQPFKQAFREVYLLTPAEENTFDYSNRFQGHYLSGNTLYSLGKVREWTMGYNDAPFRKLPGGELMAVLNINGGVLYSECSTLDLHFRKRRADTNQLDYYNSPKVALEDVPPVILSEIMRDVDLFVAVAGLGIDPHFDQTQTGDLLDYWQDASFGRKSNTAMSEIRKDLLQRLIPMTKIAKKCSFEGNFLKVKGTMRTYKINLGSGNILMEPNNQYLCIVPAWNSTLEKNIWLPFEGGDRTLMVVLSKAFLLADDDKITAQDILRQIR